MLKRRCSESRSMDGNLEGVELPEAEGSTN